MNQRFTATIEHEDNTYVALCPELDIASQGKTSLRVRKDLSEAIQLFLESASRREIHHRLHSHADPSE